MVGMGVVFVCQPVPALLNFNQLVVAISLDLSAWPDAGSRPRNLSAASSASSTVGATQVKWPIFRPPKACRADAPRRPLRR